MKNNENKFLICFSLIVFLIVFSRAVFASRVDELQQKISDNNAQIIEIQKEIEALQKQLDKTGSDAKTLKNQINRLQATVKKLQTDIKLTERKIMTANFVLEELTIGINAKEKEINNNKIALAEIVRNMNEIESQSLVEILLANNSFSEFFGDLERMNNFQDSINTNLEQLKTLKKDFEAQEAAKKKEKGELESLQSQLDDQKILVEMQKGQKNTLLKETQNKESLYKKQLAEQLAKQEAFEDEIRTLEQQIRIEINPDSLPKTGTGILSWPIENPVITQYFGNTPFATQNPQVYGGKGHDGIDLRASIGTPVKNTLSGTITAIGNTVSFCRGYQIGYGKWVLIKHDNNLSTFYSHLSLIKVSSGQSVEAGQVVGLSGNTGYATGPHLHFGVFATQAISGLEYISTSQTCGGITMRQPIVPLNGKLNPLSYLPAL